MMKSSKLQAPSSKEIPSSRFQRRNALDTLEALSEDGVGNGALVLRDGPAQVSEGRPPFDLEERTARFGENVVRFSKKIPHGPTNDRLSSQLMGTATSVGANYCEANESVSKKDFRYSISRSKKEIKETKHFLRMNVASEPILAEEARVLYREATELQRILASMYRK